MDANYKAFLDVLAYSEGTDNGRQATNNKGYDVIVGGKLFTDYKDHPRVLVELKTLGIKSSAAGRYQFIRSTWDALRQRLKLKDFGPASQDAACVELLRECGALAELDKGAFDVAVYKARRIWASLPGAGYGQREERIATLRKKYKDAGGKVA